MKKESLPELIAEIKKELAEDVIHVKDLLARISEAIVIED